MPVYMPSDQSKQAVIELPFSSNFPYVFTGSHAQSSALMLHSVRFTGLI